MTKANLQDVALQIQQMTKSQIRESEQRMKTQFESVILLIQQTADRFDHRFEELEGRFQTRFLAVESRLDRANESMVYALNHIGGFTRWADRRDRAFSSQLGTQEARQKAIDRLNERVSSPEQRNQN